MAVEAVRGAVDDAGLDIHDLDGVVCYGMNDTATARAMAYAAGVEDLCWAVDLSGGGNVVVTAIQIAAMAVSSQTCKAVVVCRSLNGRSGTRFGQPGALPTDGAAQFHGPHGYGLPAQLMAMWARRHQYTYGSTCEDLGAIAITQRHHALRNPFAIARTPLTLDHYLAGRWINEPLRVYDCAYEVDGACAVLVTSAQAARGMRQPPVRIAPGANDWTHSGGSWEQWPDLTEMFSAKVASRLWLASGLVPDDVDIACIYDCFTYTVMAALEDFGFAPKGAVGDFFRDGRATYGGDVVVNPHGGLLSEGYLHGLNHHVEAVVQLRGGAGERQVDGAEVALVTGGSGPFGGAVAYTVDG
jgi:acetyl-CoA acetyltransferase